MKIGVVGAGNWGKNIVKNLASLNALVAVADPSEEIRNKTKQENPNVTVVSSIEELLPLVDAVAIATPANTHAKLGALALNAGKDVFLEKPMTLVSSEANDLVKLAAEKKRILMIGHLLLFQPAVQWIKKYITSGALGTVSSIHQRRANLGRARKVENALWSLGVHDVAVLLNLIESKVKNISISGQSVLTKGVEDDVYLHMQFENGTQAHLHNSWLWPKADRNMTVIGSKGMLQYDEINQTVTLHKKSIDAELKNQDQGTEVVFEGHGEPLKLEMQHFIDCIKNRSEPITSGKTGLSVVEVLESASKILQKG